MDKRSFVAGSAASLVLLFSFGAALAASGGSSNPGIDLYNGTLRMHGNNLANADLVDGVNLSNPGSYLQISGNQYSVDGASIQSGTTASDVGLGNVENEVQVAESGDKMSGDLNMTGNNITNLADPDSPQDAVTMSWVNANDEDTTVDGCSRCLQVGNEVDEVTGTIKLDGGYIASMDMGKLRWTGSDVFSGSGTDGGEGDASFRAHDNVQLLSDSDVDSGGPYSCYVSGSDGSWNCDGTKNWMHDLNSTHTAYYTSQESPQVRAVYEGQVNVTNGRVNVTLPYHFSGTVSEKRPSLRVQATPHSLTNVAVTERSDEWIVIKTSSSEEVTVDYRITGIREGYEDKDVVRPSR